MQTAFERLEECETEITLVAGSGGLKALGDRGFYVVVWGYRGGDIPT